MPGNKNVPRLDTTSKCGEARQILEGTREMQEKVIVQWLDSVCRPRIHPTYDTCDPQLGSTSMLSWLLAT